jgi:protein PhnA
MCEMSETLEHPEGWECLTCGHEWAREPETTQARVVKDAHGNPLANGDSIVLVKDLPLKGSSQTLKRGMKAKGIRLVDGDHEILCKIDGIAIGLKACFVKKG